MKLQMKREALAKLNRKASESDANSDTERLHDGVLIRFGVWNRVGDGCWSGDG